MLIALESAEFRVEEMMSRSLCAALAALTLLLLPAQPVGADSPGRIECTLGARFATFQEAVGQAVTGDCRAPEFVSRRGMSIQLTTEGMLFADSASELVTFRRAGSLISDGPGGIGSEILVGGLSDQRVTREPLRARAADVLLQASLSPEHLGDGWSHGNMPMPKPQSEQKVCGEGNQPVLLGSVTSAFEHEESGRFVAQSIAAWRSAERWSLHSEVERTLATCLEAASRESGNAIEYRASIEPFQQFGDETLVIRIDATVTETGQTFSSYTAAIRYGDLLSSICTATVSDEQPDATAAVDELRRVVKVAHDRLQHAAWYLRP